MWSYETHARRKGYLRIAGIDEAGRGPLAGPVVSAAVILDPGPVRAAAPSCLDGINDSKKLTPRRRAALFDRIRRHAVAVGVGIVDAEEIDRINILQAALRSMALAVRNLAPAPEGLMPGGIHADGLLPDYLLIDGKFPISIDLPQEPIVGGDARSISIAAASIIAKVTRDRLMETYHRAYPAYGFAGHKGYPTQAHRQAIAAHGPCPIHRKTFKGVREHVDRGYIE